METNENNVSKNKEILIKANSKRQERENKIKEILADEKYINWLEKFTIQYSDINDSKFLKDNKKLSNVDIENISNLSLLFNGIARYASQNYIYPIVAYNDIEYYKIKYNNVGYYIGLSVNTYSYCYCKRVENVDDSFINFEDIINNKQQENTIYINNTLKTIYESIINYYNAGIPFDALNSTIENSLWEIKTLENKKKILRKK